MRARHLALSLVLCVLVVAHVGVNSGNKIEKWEGYVYAPSLSAWDGYRISDGIMLHSELDWCDEHPDSIVCKYRLKTNTASNFSVLLSVMDSFDVLDAPEEWNTAVMHVRIGDGLCQRIDPLCRGHRTDTPDCWHRETDCWFDKNIPRRYAFPKKCYVSIFESLRKHGIKKVIVVGDPRHWTRTTDMRNGNYNVDETYVGNLASSLQEYGIHATIRQPGTPDEDFLFMCAARVFVQSGGGFSTLIGTIVQIHRGGTTFRPCDVP